MAERLWSEYADNRYAEQRSAGFPWLKFKPELEREYRENFVDMNAWRIRFAGTIGLLAVFGFVFMDRVTGSHLEPPLGETLLLAFCIPACAIPLIATYLEGARKRLLPFMLLSVLGLSAGVLCAIVTGRATQQWFPYESLILVTAYVFFVSGVTFYQAIVTCGLLWIAFVWTNWSLQEHWKLVYEAYYLFVANMVGWLGLYLLEHQVRNEFLLRRELHQQALLDSLTGLMNRRAFSSHLDAAWLQAQRERTSIGLMVLDIDHFKTVNDTFGHLFGDSALQHIGQVLKRSAKRPMDGAARYGGDEFIVWWFGVDAAWLEKLACEMPSRVGGLPCVDASDSMALTVSGGAVLAWPQPGMKVQDAVKAADDLLYETKRGPRGSVGYRMLGTAAGAQEKSAA